jgi:hypothetical protein
VRVESVCEREEGETWLGGGGGGGEVRLGAELGAKGSNGQECG